MLKRLLIILTLLLCLTLPLLAEEVTIQGQKVKKDIEVLDLGRTKVSRFNVLIEELAQLPKLQKVDLFHSRPTEKQAFALTAAYPDIRFGMTLTIAGFHCRTDDVIFSMHRRGEPLYKSAAFNQLALCPDMLALDLGHNRITDLDFLKLTPKVKYLILADNQIKDLSGLTHLKDLQYLELFMNKLTDISPLAELGELVDLNIAFNEIADLSPLYGLTKLERIWLSRNGLSQEQINALQETLPDAVINNTARLATQEGWRQHPRFFAMRHTFDRSEFIPFDDIPERVIKKK